MSQAPTGERIRCEHTPLAPPCECCDDSAWEYLFSDRELDLGRCRTCGLHYVAQLDKFLQGGDRNAFYEDTGILLDASLQLEDEQLRTKEFQNYIDCATRFAPSGKWMDMGCGTGTLIEVAEKRGIVAEGIELTPDRAALARRLTRATIYERPLEQLAFPEQSFAVVIAVNVFSHLRRPTVTLAEVRRVLVRGGILMIVTGEIGPGLRKHHNFSWPLGEELYYLGDNTIERYAKKLGFELVHRQRQWLPDVLYGKDRFRQKGGSALRNIVKKAFLYTPGALPALRALVFHAQRDNPAYSSTLLLRSF